QFMCQRAQIVKDGLEKFSSEFKAPPCNKQRHGKSCGVFALMVGQSVGRSTRWLSDDNSRMLGPRIMKLHRYIDHDMQMTPIDFEVTRSKVKVTMTPIDFQVTRSKVKVTET
ncbi:hypothetical protein DPMN_144940, partial [Dreissena polymorpha]